MVHQDLKTSATLVCSYLIVYFSFLQTTDFATVKTTFHNYKTNQKTLVVNLNFTLILADEDKASEVLSN